jgi:hypothetical protein
VHPSRSQGAGMTLEIQAVDPFDEPTHGETEAM